YPGPRHGARRVTAWGLMVLFAVAPWLQIGGKPLILLDLPRRQFTLFGQTFLPTDGVLLMLLLLSIFVAVIWITALVGRGWCGWACPQTVYMEFLFRPIERWFEGRREDQLRLDRGGPSLRRVAKNVVFLAVAFALANVFLSYFVGPRTLLAWMQLSPLEHWSPFVIVAVTTGLVFFDFAVFREQMCTTVCPYARLQSVLLDKQSLIIGYDRPRGEPRGKGKPLPGRGDCIDCGACVVACPTGIDIRDGLQLECIACAQCADACDGIMTKIKKPVGLIRYGSQATLETRAATRVLRPRVIAYPILLAVLLGALVLFAATKPVAEVTVLRGIGAPFTQRGDLVTGELRVKVQNRSERAEQYRIELVAAPHVELIAPENPLEVAAGAQRTTAVFAVAPRASFSAGRREIRVRVASPHGFSVEVPYRLLGPSVGSSP
ncbi:MAG TPA: cytochrome c oxidase accessory protein CcoG, partial [Polyangiaceae bacterium]